MPTVAEVLKMDDFWALPLHERRKVLTQLAPDFGGLPTKEQDKVVGMRPTTAAEDKGFFSTLGEDIVGLPGATYEAISDPRRSLRSLAEAHKEQFGKAKEEFQSGHYVEAAGHGLAGILPGIGPAAAKAGEEIGAGQTGQGIAHATELIAPIAGRAAVTKGVSKLARTKIPEIPRGTMAEDVLGVVSPRSPHLIAAANRVARIANRLRGLDKEASKPTLVKRPGLKPPRFGGSYEPEIEATPGKIIPRGKFEAPKAAAGKGTKTPYGGSDNPYGGKSYPMARKKLPGATEIKAPPADEAATADATRVADRLREAGIDLDRWESATLDQKKAVLAKLNYVGGIGKQALKDIAKALGK